MLLLQLEVEKMDSPTEISFVSIHPTKSECVFILCKLSKQARSWLVHRLVTYKNYSSCTDNRIP